MRYLFIAFFIFFEGLAWAKPVSNIVMFGDSLSDNGNLYAYLHEMLPQSPPYYQGRFTNGIVWVERLAQAYFPENSNSHLLDYAFGGAGVAESSDDDDVLFTLKREIDSYFLIHSNESQEDNLFLIWIGANNYLGLPTEEEKTLSDVNQGIEHSLERLINSGAKHIMLLNLPDLGETPLGFGSPMQEKLTYFSNKHNQLLKNTVDQLKESHPEVQVILFDVNQLLHEMKNFPERYGFTNTTEACSKLMEEPNLTKKQDILHLVSKVKRRADPQVCDSYLFFDPVHPTARSHQIMAEQAKLFLDAQGITF